MKFIKGNTPWNKNRKLSDRHKGNLRSSHLGIKHSEATKEKHRKLMSGKRNINWGKFGKEHPCYKENKVHYFYKIIRETFKYRQWRSDIFTRDGFVCVLCGTRGCELNADHYPKRFIDIIREYNIRTLEEALNCEELWNINNGRTLCIKCHLKTDTWGRRPLKISSN